MSRQAPDAIAQSVLLYYIPYVEFAGGSKCNNLLYRPLCCIMLSPGPYTYMSRPSRALLIATSALRSLAGVQKGYSFKVEPYSGFLLCTLQVAQGELLSFIIMTT